MDSIDAIRGYLRRYGPSSGPALQRQLGLSRSVFQRTLRPLPPDILRVGRARATRYAARRTVPGVTTPIPVYEVGSDGSHRHALTLHPVAPFGSYVESHAPDVSPRFHGTEPDAPAPEPCVGLPWFLWNIAPSGFLGRAWVRTHPDEGYPPRLDAWTTDDVLRFATRHGTDLPGAFVLGGFARNAFRPAAPVTALAAALPAMAERALVGRPGPSSAGGDQPKLTATLRDPDGSVRHAIIKFSPPRSTATGERWADLLLAEHTALALLREEGIDAATTRIIDAGDRRFLVVDRFDRHGASGRSGAVSLFPLDSGIGTELQSWSAVTARLAADGRLDPADHARTMWLEAFGHLIANADMHLGNLSVRVRGTRILGLAPVYDMLPMAFAPRHGEVRSDPYNPAVSQVPLAPARDAARELWSRIVDDDAFTSRFRALAQQQRSRV